MTGAVTGLLMLATLIAAVRLVVRWRQAPAAGRVAPWRMAVLLVAQPVCAGLLYLALVPAATRSGGTLIVLTHNGNLIGGGHVVALPEAAAAPGAERVPDLATALRRYAPIRLKVIGDGLEPRDLAAATDIPIDFTPPPAPTGLIRVDFPGPVAPGATFAVGGRVGGIAGAGVDLVDPAGQRVDFVVPNAAGDFVVSGTARTPGPSRFTLRVRAGSRLAEEAIVPVSTVAVPPARLLLLAGAPSPEIKYLRRWATEAGLIVHSQIATGDGLALGDAPVAITATTLQKFDVAVVDQRSWTGLSVGDRSIFIAAVRNGLGLLVRIDGPLSAPARQDLGALGFSTSGGDGTAPVALRAPVDESARLARDGPGTPDDPGGLNRNTTAPPLTRWRVGITATTASPLITDLNGAALATWRPEGAGRIALWPLDESFRLVLNGHAADYDQLWRTAFATLGRGRGEKHVTVEQPASVGRRLAICGLAGSATVTAPDGGVTTLIVDPLARCAAYWPRISGWHEVRQAGQSVTLFAAGAAETLPNVRAAANRAATLQLASIPSIPSSAAPLERVRGTWFWLALWLAVAIALWWFERSRFGVRVR